MENTEQKTGAEKVAQVVPTGKTTKRIPWQALLENPVAWLILVVAVAVGAGGTYYKYQIKNVIKPEVVKQKVTDFAKEMGAVDFEVKEVVEENGLYKLKVSMQKQESNAYVTKDGKLFFQGGLEIEKTLADKKAAEEKKNQPIPKTAKPKVELFVMSYCPYGLQMERGMLPVVEALGDKIDFSLKFVSYTLHGQKEIDENVKQYCVQKTQPTKLGAYLKCFWKDSKGLSDTCLRTVGINAAQINTCVASAKKEFTLTEKDFSIDKAANTQYGVQGSPTLVINGVVKESSRDANSILQAVCGAFENAPEACQKALATTQPGAGFDDQISTSAGAASAPAASCGS